MRAREPDETGFADGIYWERFGDAEPTLLMVPAWAIVHSRIWKAQVPYLARHFRVVIFDPRGNGLSKRPADLESYSEEQYAADALAVMEASGTESAVVVGLSMGAQRGLLLAARQPERVLALVTIAAALPLASDPERNRSFARFDDRLEHHDGWFKFNRHYWRQDYEGFLRFFFENAFAEPHSTKQFEDCVSWGLETDPETLALTILAPSLTTRAETLALCEQVRCPVLAVHGDCDQIRPWRASERFAAATGGRFVLMPGCGHCPQARKPVEVNLLIREFVEQLPRTAAVLSRQPLAKGEMT